MTKTISIIALIAALLFLISLAYKQPEQTTTQTVTPITNRQPVAPTPTYESYGGQQTPLQNAVVPVPVPTPVAPAQKTVVVTKPASVTQTKPAPVPAPVQPTPTPAPTPAPAPVVLASVSVSIQNFAFTPTNLTVKKGTTVTWTNKDSIGHTVTGDSGISSALLSQGESYSFTFNQTGQFSYHCNPHPGMIGTVTVTE